jgi:hypothetical protein
MLLSHIRQQQLQHMAVVDFENINLFSWKEEVQLYHVLTGFFGAQFMKVLRQRKLITGTAQSSR